MKHRVLVIDEDEAIRDSLWMILDDDGFECLSTPGGDEGLARIGADVPDMVILDVKMPGMDGLEVLRRIRHVEETLSVVLISGHGTV